MLHPGLKRYSYLLVLVLFFGMQAAQAHRLSPPVKGVVTDSYGHPLAGVRIALKGESRFVVSNGDGAFRIDAGPGAILVFTHPAFNVSQVKVSGRKGAKALAVRLSERVLQGQPFMVNTEIGGRAEPVTDSENTGGRQGDTIALPAAPNDKIDVLYGQVSRQSFLGSIATVSGNEISGTPASSYMYAMQGRLVGLDMNQLQGFTSFSTAATSTVNGIGINVPNTFGGEGPTDNTEFNITIRGHGESAGQSPIAIVDGVQRELYSIDPQSIKSISVLKDPLSTLLLGQNSSRGAIIVTTKEPEVGATRLTISAETGTQTALGLPKPLPAYQYAYLVNEAVTNSGEPAAYTEADFNAYRNHTDPIGHPDVNWYKTILQPDPLLTRVNLNAAGGSLVARYVINLNYMDEEGMFVNSPANSYNTNLQLQRYMVNSKIDVDVNKDFEIKLQLFGRLQDGNQPGGNISGGSNTTPVATPGGVSSILSGLLSTPNNAYPLYNPSSLYHYGGNASYGQNLMAETVGSGYVLDHLRDVLSNLNLHYKLDKVAKGLWVNASGDVSVESEASINRALEPKVYQMAVSASKDTTYNGFGYSVPESNTYNSTAWARYRFFQFTAGYDRKFGLGSFSAELLGDQKRQLIDYDIPSELTNFGAKASYNWSEKYFVEGAADYSGYDRYAPGHQFGLFYAGGLGWDVTKETFFKNLFPWVNHFKLRATYGLNGNANVDNYGYFIWREQYAGGLGNYSWGSNYNSGSENTSLEGGTPGNQVLNDASSTWERADKFDGGTDLAFLHNTLLFTADYYRERYFDVMQQPGNNIELIGIGYPAENMGVDLYQGAEVTLTYQNRLGNFNYFVTGNASVQQTKVIYEDEQYEQNSWNKQTGRPVGQLFGYIANGLFQTAAQAAAAPTITGYTPQAGDVRYEDLNHDGVINQFDEAPLGKGRPLIYYGPNLGFNYDGIEFSALFQGMANREEYENNQYVNEGFLSQNNEYSQAYQQILGRWIPENAATATSPRLTAGGNTYNYSPNGAYSSYFLQNGDYVRLKNLYLGYNLPYRLLKRAKVGGIKIFASAQNLFTYAAYKGVDPEVALPSYPIQRVVNFGVTLKL